MNKIVTHKEVGAPDQAHHRPDIATVMKSALAPYHLLDEWCFGSILYEARNMLTRESATGELFVLKTTDRSKRFEVHCRAHNLFDELPPDDLILTKFNAITTAINTEPSPKERKYLIGAMLDALGIQASDGVDGYISALSFSLADVPPDDLERAGPERNGRGPKPPRWIPLAALADAVKRIWEGQRENNYGRPPPIGYVLEECTRSRRDLTNIKSRIDEIGMIRQGLQKIIAATDDSYPNDD